MSYKFQVYPQRSISLLAAAITGNSTEYRWRLKAPNGNIMADSGEAYSTKANCLRAVDAVKEAIKNAKVEETTS